MATANRIAIMKINPKLRFSRSFGPAGCGCAIVFISGKHGLQVWYEHDGDCGSCDEYAKCIELLWDYAGELGIVLNRTADPTKMAEELFARVMGMI